VEEAILAACFARRPFRRHPLPLAPLDFCHAFEVMDQSANETVAQRPLPENAEISVGRKYLQTASV
jgi:hypothetical protein